MNVVLSDTFKSLGRGLKYELNGLEIANCEAQENRSQKNGGELM